MNVSGVGDPQTALVVNFTVLEVTGPAPALVRMALFRTLHGPEVVENQLERHNMVTESQYPFPGKPTG